jgi:hypothetical protein
VSELLSAAPRPRAPRVVRSSRLRLPSLALRVALLFYGLWLLISFVEAYFSPPPWAFSWEEFLWLAAIVALVPLSWRWPRVGGAILLLVGIWLWDLGGDFLPLRWLIATPLLAFGLAFLAAGWLERRRRTAEVARGRS